MEHPYSEFIEQLLDDELNKITLQLTQLCNLNCSYCVYSKENETNRNHSQRKMSFRIAKTAIDFLLKHSNKSERANVSFYGGEPLLEFDLIKQCIRYTEKKFTGKNVSFNLTFNLNLLKIPIFKYSL